MYSQPLRRKPPHHRPAHHPASSTGRTQYAIVINYRKTFKSQVRKVEIAPLVTNVTSCNSLLADGSE